VTIPSIALAYLASFAWPGQRWYDGAIGAVVGYGLPWAIGELYYLIRRREAMGLGDGMLLAVVGALLGWHGVVAALSGGSMIGTVIVLTALLVRRAGGEPPPTAAPAAPESDRDRDPGAAGPAPGEPERPSALFTEVPFGAFLAIAAVLYLFAEPWVQFHFHLPGA
jgi:prepilin signal peptidase PulO-like enzyme (type II secretory pathway)